MGLLHFARRKAQAVVLEVGLGGRLDSTNVVHPALSIITSIAFDHTRQLGNTLGAIASEKAGILKRSRPAVSGVCGRRAAAGDPPGGGPAAVSAPRAGDRLPLRGHRPHAAPGPPHARPRCGSGPGGTNWGTLSLPLLGLHQAHNAAVALAGLDLLAEVEPALEVGRDAVVRGLRRAPLAGAGGGARRDRPGWSSTAPTTSPRPRPWPRRCGPRFPATPRTLVFGTTRDKDLPGQLRALFPCSTP